VAFYKKVPFDSGSHGLNQLVVRAQNYPSSVLTRAKAGGAPRQNILNGCLDLADRITTLNPKGPGGGSIPQALSIVWGVYHWLQNHAMQANVSANNPKSMSLDAYFKGLSGGDL